jgi:hypothetical protein
LHIMFEKLGLYSYLQTISSARVYVYPLVGQCGP